MAGNPTVEVQKYGQSLWYDNLSRDMIRTGELQDLIDNYGILGMTSNPTIFEKAIGEGKFYDESISTMLDLDASDVFDNLAIDDIQHATDLLRPIFDRTKGIDGYVSLEVSPLLANDTETTLSEAKRLFKAVDRPNLMIKIPGTPAGLPAIEEALFAGLNINITLLFSVANYLEVMERFLRALERRHEAGLPIDHIASVASFFVSRIDSVVDKQLEANIKAAEGRDEARVEANQALLGKVAIANAKIAYKRFLNIFSSDRFSKLKEAGAQVQRPLWASTGTKNPAYPDTLYMDTLIGQNTVNTVPKTTLLAFKDHGTAEPTLEKDLDKAQEALDKLAEVGIDLDKITQKLQVDGVASFIDSFKKLIERVEDKRKALTNVFIQRQELVLGEYKKPVVAELKHLYDIKAVERIWSHDAPLWRNTPDHIKSITTRLGWLTVANNGNIDRDQLRALRAESQRMGWKHVVLLGMGGSSLAPEVLARTFGSAAGFPQLLVLDSTDPTSIAYIEKTIDLEKTVFIVASKSGTTLETLSMQRYFYAMYNTNPGDHFIAVTDPGSKLEGWAKELKFRHTFLNPDDIGGRYSALSYFGMVPAALIGLDFEKIQDTAVEMQTASGMTVLGSNNPGLWLGAIMGTLAKHGRDKITILTSSEISSYGDWAEQLIAESTGKENKGIIPVTGGAIGHRSDVSDDRLFVYLRLDDSAKNPDAEVHALQNAGHPLVTFNLRNKFDIGAEFWRWEFATAVAGVVLEINPFDELNVTESKNNTNRLLKIFEEQKQLPTENPILTEDGVSLYADVATAQLLQELSAQQGYTGFNGLLATFLGLAHSGDYVALMAYLRQSPEHIAALESVRSKIRHTFKRAVTLGFGPRFLHSTGQLHKGGPNTGVYVQFTVNDDANPMIPEAHYGFATLKQAQAAGDMQSLQVHGRRVVRIHLGNSIESGLNKVLEAIAAAEAKRL